MAKVIRETATTVTLREYGRERTVSRFIAEVFDGRGTANIIDRVSGEVVGHAVGVHTEAEAVAQFTAEQRDLSRLRDGIVFDAQRQRERWSE